MLPGSILIPHAIDIQGQTVRVFDPRVHHEVVPPPDDAIPGDGRGKVVPISLERRHDYRWAICRRPVIMAGGELTLADLELRYSPQAKFYIASLQVKANCGV